MSNSLQRHGLQPARLLCQWDFPSQNTGVGCHFLLQGIFPNPGNELRSRALQADSLTSEPAGKHQQLSSSYYQSGQTSRTQLLHPTQMLSESFKDIVLVPSSSSTPPLTLLHPTASHPSLPMLSPEVFTPPLLPSGPTTALWVSVLLCLLQVLNVSSFCCLVELAKLNRKQGISSLVSSERGNCSCFSQKI